MFVVYRKAMIVRFDIVEFETEDEAVDFCDARDWEMMDENGFVWDLGYYEN